MKYYTRLKIYKSSNCEFNPETQVGKSYGWWVVTTPHKGEVLFNDTYYSSSTCKHQNKIHSHVTPTVVLKHTRECLSNPDKALRNEIEGLFAVNAELFEKIATPRSHKKKNAERIFDINTNGQRIVYLNELFDLGVDLDASQLSYTKLQGILNGTTKKVA